MHDPLVEEVEDWRRRMEGASDQGGEGGSALARVVTHLEPGAVGGCVTLRSLLERVFA